ncbi:MAG: hypothetical protein QM736_20425 [Vicinamibacterales bacterium]
MNPPPFAWEAWYEAVGGRTIAIDEVSRYLRQIYEDQEPRFTGPVAEDRHVFASPADASAHLKMRAREFGADLVGVCEIEPSDVYRGRTVDGRFAIAVGQRMRWREFQVVPSRESAIECLRVYLTLGETVIRLAEDRSAPSATRARWSIQWATARCSTFRFGLKAGFGELGRHGSIINPELGPLFRMGSVATSLDLAIDHPIDAGIAKFCDTCHSSTASSCPAHAIPDNGMLAGVDRLGHPRYVVDAGRCFPYFATHNYCSICLPVCVYNHKEWARDFEGFTTRLFPTVVMHDPPRPANLPREVRHVYPLLNRP